jgi:oxygen-dependent protoporphyrinogen oxidase
MRERKDQPNDVQKPPQFIAFKDGSQAMIDMIEEKLDAEILKGTEALKITENSGKYELKLSGKKKITADVVILATPSNISARLISNFGHEAAELLNQIEQKNIGTAVLIYAANSLEIPYDINGLMVPRREKRHIDAVTWSTNKPLFRAPDNYEMLRVFFGGGDPSLVTKSEEEIISTILDELKDIFGITAVPLKHFVHCWPEGFPQAKVGHLQLVDEIESHLPEGIFVAGNSFRGIGVPDCIKSGREAAEKALEFINN